MNGTGGVVVVAWLVVAMSLSVITPSSGSQRRTLRSWAAAAAVASLVSACAHFVAADLTVDVLFDRRMIDDPIARLLGTVVVALGAAAFVRARVSDRTRASTALAAVAALVGLASRDLLVSWVSLEIAAFAAKHAGPARPESGRVDRAVTLLGALGIGLTMFATASTQLDAVASAVTSAFTQWGAAQPYVDIVELAERGDGVPAGLLQQARAKAITGLTPVALLLAGLCALLVAALARVGMWPISETPTDRSLDAGFSARALVQVAAWAIVLRVFVSELATARMVAAPYGWTQALPTLAVLGALGAVFVPLQPHGTGGVLLAARRARVGLLLLLATGAATMLGNGRLQARVESGTWATAVAEWTIAAFVVLLGMGLLAELALVLAADERTEGGPLAPSVDDVEVWDAAGSGAVDVGIVGLVHRSPARAVLLVVALLAIAGAAPTMGGIAWWMASLALAEHSAMLWIWPLVLVGQLAVLRHVYVTLAALAAAAPPAAAPSRSGETSPADARSNRDARGSEVRTFPPFSQPLVMQVAVSLVLVLPWLAPTETMRRLQLVGTAFHVNATREAGKAARLRRVAEVEAARDGRTASAPHGGARDGAGVRASAPGGESSSRQSGRDTGSDRTVELGSFGRVPSDGGGGQGVRSVAEGDEPAALGFEDETRGMSVERLPSD